LAMPTLYLSPHPDNFQNQRVLIAARYAPTLPEVVELLEQGLPLRPPASCPLPKLPALESRPGVWVSGPAAVAQLLCPERLRGQGPAGGALVQQWVSYADGEIAPAACAAAFSALGLAEQSKQVVERAVAELRRALAVLDGHLKLRTYLVAEAVTLADVTVACALLLPYKYVLDPPSRAPYPNVTRWFLTCVNQPQFQAVLGPVKLCEQARGGDAPVKSASQLKKEAKKKEKLEKFQQKKEKSQQQQGEVREMRPALVRGGWGTAVRNAAWGWPAGAEMQPALGLGNSCVERCLVMARPVLRCSQLWGGAAGEQPRGMPHESLGGDRGPCSCFEIRGYVLAREQSSQPSWGLARTPRFPPQLFGGEVQGFCSEHAGAPCCPPPRSLQHSAPRCRRAALRILSLFFSPLPTILPPGARRKQKPRRRRRKTPGF
uniref:GST C-terminal domain-containing protein n=1 Tax=Terrapene triunguis TaxID=2587831 RepID=A0A674ILB0_9SAUR